MDSSANLPASLSIGHVVHVGQGEYFVSRSHPVTASTVLGSCVAVTVFAPELGRGAMNHCVLPRCASNSESRSAGPGYFVDSSIELIYGEMLRIGADPARLVVKVFGAASVLCPGQFEEGFRVGRKNGEAALEALRQLGLEAARIDLGGYKGRKLLFHPHRGDVWVKKLSRNTRVNEVRHG